MTRGGRKFDHEALEAVRLMAVERVREGERPSSVVASFGFSRTVMARFPTKVFIANIKKLSDFPEDMIVSGSRQNWTVGRTRSQPSFRCTRQQVCWT